MEGLENIVHIDKKVVKVGKKIISVNNISEVSTFVPKPKFPTWTIVLIILGLAAFSVRGLMTIGIIALVIGAAGIVYYYYACSSQPKGLVISTNSGKTTVLSFPDHELAERIVSAIEESMQTENVSQVFNLPDATINNSPIGNIGGLFGYGK